MLSLNKSLLLSAFLIPTEDICVFNIDHIDPLQFPFFLANKEKIYISSFTHLEQILP